jgi:hypothetical protein
LLSREGSYQFNCSSLYLLYLEVWAMVAAMTAKKRGPAAKGVALPKHKANASAFDKLPENPTEKQLENAAVSVALADLEQRVADVRDSWETDSLFEDVIDELSSESQASTLGKFSCGVFFF